ncbi:MAG: tail fiber domain-containing protein, partial [Dysgonamonadaceae bacterium]|nr:tail fiber domain-containing protein [Dysgonamonadaceae bacterium]
NSSVTSIGGYAAWSNVSDARIKKNIRANVPGLDFINLLQPVTYNLDLDAADKIIYGDRKEKSDSLNILGAEERETEKAAREERQKQLLTGFVAQDVEKAAQSIGYDFSGVDADKNGKGLYGLRYSEFVVPLVKAVQELSEQNDAKDAAIASLKDELAELKDDFVSQQRKIDQLSDLVSLLLGTDSKSIGLRSGNAEENQPTGNETVTSDPASLQQNFPNPFSQSTVIRYSLPSGVLSAQIVVTDASGRIVKILPLSGKGEGSVTIEAASLQAGIYHYSLLTDNRLIDTKKMVLTE